MPQPDLSQLLERGAAHPQTPGDVNDVWQRGQSRRRRKRAALASSAVAAIAVAAVVTMLWQRPTAPFIQSGPDDAEGWGPLAVVPGEPVGDQALTQGTLHITDRCVMLNDQGDDVLLMWPADATAWNAAQRTITFTTRDGATIELRDGTQVSFGGSGDSIPEGNESPRAWINRHEWVSAPAPECVTDTRWWITDVVDSASHMTVPNVLGLSLAQARERLEVLGLRGEPVSGPGWSDPTDPQAVVVGQEPSAGALVSGHAVVGFRTALITPELCDVFTDVPQREGDAHALASASGFWDMLERAEPVASPALSEDIRTLLDFRQTGQPLEQAPAKALDRVTTHHDACHAKP